MNALELLISTGFGSCLMLMLGCVGIPLAYWFEKRRPKP